jgi:hypothetical protein
MSDAGASRFWRALLALAALILIGGALLHASAFGQVSAGVAGAPDLKPVLGNALKALWLADSTTLISVGLVLILIVLRPAHATAAAIALLALIPGFTAVFLYQFLGFSAPAHLMLAATALIILGAASRGRG